MTFWLALALCASPPPQLAAMPLVAKKFSAETVQILDLILVSELEASGRFRVVRPADIDAMLGLEKMKDSLGCDAVSCATEIANALGVQLLMTGTVGKLGDEFVIHLTLIDTAHGQVLHRGQATSPIDEKSYRDAVKRAVGDVLQTTAKPPAAEPVPQDIKKSRLILRFDTKELKREFDVALLASDGQERNCHVDDQNPCIIDALPVGETRLHATSPALKPYDLRMSVEDRKETATRTLSRQSSTAARVCWIAGVSLAVLGALVIAGTDSTEPNVRIGGVAGAVVGVAMFGTGFLIDHQVGASTSRVREDAQKPW